MSSVVTIGFPDRARACIQTEFTPPLADDERRELLIHAALLTGRAFAALPPERQRSLSGVLREWIADRFAQCPVQVVAGDDLHRTLGEAVGDPLPQACPQRFASTFLAPAREYALATAGCDRETGAIEYFLPMATAVFLRHVAVTDRDPDELLKPALALCAAVAIHPVTMENHFQMATASLPKIGPVIDRTPPIEPAGRAAPPAGETTRRPRDQRRSLLVSAGLAALVIIGGVQYLSTRGPQTEVATQHVGQPKPAPTAESAPSPVPPKPSPPPSTAPSPDPQPSALSAPVPPPAPVAAPLSPQARAYLRKARDLAENSVAQVEVMVAATKRRGVEAGELAETLDAGARRVQTWRRQFSALAPPRALTAQHREVSRFLADLGGIAQILRSGRAAPPPPALQERLAEMHDRLDRILNDADAF